MAKVDWKGVAEGADADPKCRGGQSGGCGGAQ